MLNSRQSFPVQGHQSFRLAVVAQLSLTSFLRRLKASSYFLRRFTASISSSSGDSQPRCRDISSVFLQSFFAASRRFTAAGRALISSLTLPPAVLQPLHSPERHIISKASPAATTGTVRARHAASCFSAPPWFVACRDPLFCIQVPFNSRLLRQRIAYLNQSAC